VTDTPLGASRLEAPPHLSFADIVFRRSQVKYNSPTSLSLFLLD